MSPQVVLTSTRAVLTLPDTTLLLTPATITISTHTGRITSIVPAVLPPTSFPLGTTYINHSPHILLPGLVDAHVHLNEPGRTEWEGFETGTRAAAAGGVTTVVDMPLNSIPPTTTVAALKTKVAAAKNQCWVDVGFYGGVVPGNEEDLIPLVDMGVRGFKCFLIDSGVEEFPAVTPKDVASAMQVLKDAPTTFMFHAEMDCDASEQPSTSNPLPPTSYNTFLESRPPTFETTAVSEILNLAHTAPNLNLHIVHLSATECIPMLREARQKGVKITAETCFHYLELAAEGIEDGDTRHKCCPPIRTQKNRDALWEELKRPDSCIRTVVSDHSPCTPELKILPQRFGGHGHRNGGDKEEGGSTGPLADSAIDLEMSDAMESKTTPGDFMAAWGGISSVGLGLPILHTAAKDRGLSIVDIVRLCCSETAKQVGLSKRKGSLQVGLDADICVFDDGEEWTLTKGEMRWKNSCSPWEGKTFRGRVKETWVRGQRVWDGEKIVGRPIGDVILERRER